MQAAPRSNNIEAEGLTRQFKKGPLAVDGIDLRVDPGEIYGFLGPNGAGKSTTVHMLTTLLPPTGGSGRVAGHDIAGEGPRVQGGDRGRTPGSGPRPAPDRARAHAPADRPPRAAPAPSGCSRGDALIERVGLADAADRKVGGYSGGMKRRLDLALALVHGPRVLFLDEPTTGLDPQSRAALWDEVARLAGEDGRDRLPHHPVPGGGRPARRPGRDHRRRQDRRRRDAGGAEGGDRPAQPRGRARRPGRGRAGRWPCSSASASGSRPPARRSPSASPAAPSSSPTSSGPSTGTGCGSPTSTCGRRASTTSSSSRPGATSRAPAAEGDGRGAAPLEGVGA